MDFRTTHKLSTKPREKWLAGPAVVSDVLRFLWELDEYEFPHPRMRPQLALSLLILYIGLRPGEFAESKAHVGSNEGLHWGDVQFMMLPGRDQQPLWRVKITLRNRKNERGREDRVWGNPRS